MIDRRPIPVRQPWLDPLVSFSDDRFRIPGTNIRYGADAIIGVLAPAVGDSITTALGAIVLAVAWKDGAPLNVLIRMAANLGVDAVVGAIPVVGDIFDVGYRANRKNHTLLRAFQSAKFGTTMDSDRDAVSQVIAGQNQSGVNKRSWALGVLLLLLVTLLVILPLALLAAVGTWVFTQSG